MKTRYFLLLLFLSACQAPSNDSENNSKPIENESKPTNYDFNGHWKWNENKEAQHIFELVLEQKDSFVNGFICAIAETPDGQRIDCGYGDGYAKYNLSGPIRENVIQADITGAYSRQHGRAMVIHNKNSLRWTILQQPGNDYMEDYFFPNEAVLIPEDRKSLRKVPYRKNYVWESSPNATNASGFSGKWMLTDFLDSTLLQKKVMPFVSFSKNPHTHFMTVLDFSPLPDGKLRIASDIEDGLTPIERVNSHTLAFKSEPYAYQLTTVKDGRLLKLSTFQQNTATLIREYYYRQGSELLLELDFNALGLHFNKILEGSYQIIGQKENSKRIQFGPEYTVQGMEAYDSYKVHWQAEPGTPELDAIEMINTPKDDRRFFHFRFEENTLILYDLNTTADPESGFYEYKIADVFLQLKPI